MHRKWGISTRPGQPPTTWVSCDGRSPVSCLLNTPKGW